jgi:hypothetical protein
MSDDAQDREDPQAWWGPPVAGDEVATLIGSLERQRATFAWKVGGLDRAALSTTVGASAITLGGLVKHLAFTEVIHFCTRVMGQRPGDPWEDVDWDAEPEWPWTSAAEDEPAYLYGLWRDSVVRARASLAEAIAEGGLDRPTVWSPDGSDVRPSARRVLADMVEEYARHTGHADLIREAVDGVVGEDPPSAPVLYPLPERRS